MNDIKKQEKKINNKNEKFIFENKVLSNGMILEKLDLSAHLNLFYAKNGTAKTSIYNFLKNDFPKKLNNEYEIISYSYLEELKNKNRLLENLKRLNLLNDSKDFIKSNNQLNNLINDIKDEYNIFLQNKEFLIGYSENIHFLSKKINEKESSFELFVNNLHFFISNILGNKKSLMEEFVKNFYMCNFNLDKISNKDISSLILEISKFNESLKYKNDEKQSILDKLDKDIESTKINKYLTESVKNSLIDKYEENKKTTNNDFDEYFKNNFSTLEGKISALFFEKNSRYGIYNYNQKKLSDFLNWFKSKCKIFKNNINFDLLNFFVENVYFFNILFKFYAKNINFFECINKINFNSFKSKIKKIINIYKIISQKKSKRKSIENIFNNFFFNYISFSIIKTIDLFFLDQDLNINIYLNNKILNLDNDLINKMSDGELNAILLISLYFKCINSNNPFILLLDDASISFDRNNWLGLLRLLLEIFSKNKENKLIIFSHDSSFIRISSKFFSSNLKKRTIYTKSIIKKDNKIKIYSPSLKLKNLLKSNFLLLHFFELLKYSNEDEKKCNIESMLHYSKNFFINDFIDNLLILDTDKNNLKEDIKKYNLTLEKNIVFDLFESIYNDKDKNLYLIDFFYLRFLIEKFVSNYNSESCDDGTLKFIDNSSLSQEIKDRLKYIYSYLPTFIHCDFFDISYFLNFDNNEAIANFIDDIKEMLKDYEKNKFSN